MDKKLRAVVICIIIYMVMFLVGFRLGEIYSRNQKRPVGVLVPPNRMFYVVEEIGEGPSRRTEIRDVGSGDIIIRLLLNKDLRHLLKAKKIKIYSSRGIRIY